MSRIGKQPIKILENVKIGLSSESVKVSGPKGELTIAIPKDLKVSKEDNAIICEPKAKSSSLWGLTRSQINNAVIGVSSGWTKILELVGVGYRAAVEAGNLILTVGFSHPVKIEAPKNITFSVSENRIIISGFDKQAVGEVAAKIRKIRPPEPYKGKGIRYKDELIRKKLGKAAKAIGGAAGGAGGKK